MNAELKEALDRMWEEMLAGESFLARRQLAQRREGVYQLAEKHFGRLIRKD